MRGSNLLTSQLPGFKASRILVSSTKDLSPVQFRWTKARLHPGCRFSIGAILIVCNMHAHMIDGPQGDIDILHVTETAMGYSMLLFFCILYRRITSGTGRKQPKASYHDCCITLHVLGKEDFTKKLNPPRTGVNLPLP